MICNYTFDDTGKTVVTPQPIFYDSFQLAGDDFLFLLIDEIIIKGAGTGIEEEGCSGVIKSHLLSRGLTESDASAKINNFFGTNANALGHRRRQLRKKFNAEVSIPIAIKYLENAIAEGGQRVWEGQFISFKDLFPDRKPNQEVLDDFRRNFDFSFEELQFKMSTEKVNRLLVARFNELTRQICAIFDHYGCDLVLLSGKLTSIKKFVDLITERYPVSPDRIISLNEYRVGRWYPFSDGNGYFADKKSIVSVGAMVALMGGRMDRIANFRINTELLKRVRSTTNYIGAYNATTKTIGAEFTPITHNCTLKVAGFPVNLGATLIGHNNYPTRVIYQIELNTEMFKFEQIRSAPNLANDEAALTDALEMKKRNLNNRMPFEIVLSRDYNTSKEQLNIQQITDKEGNQLGNNTLLLKVKTLPSEYYYWLDNGEFI